MKTLNKKIGEDNMNKNNGNKANSFAVVRADDISKVKTALCDLVRYARLNFSDKARKLEPVFADNILIRVMKGPLKASCGAASIVPLDEEASAAIGRIRKIHPPAHVIIVSPRHDIFYELIEYIDILPEMDLNLEQMYNDNSVKQLEPEKESSMDTGSVHV